MRDAFAEAVAWYYRFFGTSKILLLFLISCLAMVLMDENESDDVKRRRLNPTVFLLSLWSGVSYVCVSLLSEKKRPVSIASVLIFVVISALCGRIVISPEAYQMSVYYYTNTKITIISAISIIVFFIIYFMIARQLFCKKRDIALFMLFVFILHLFGFYSEPLSAFSLFLSPVTVQSIIVHDIMPILLWLYLVYEPDILRFLESGGAESGNKEFEELEESEEWDMKKHKILNMRNLGAAFVLLTVVFTAVVFVLNSKINSLYNATNDLVKAANTKVSVYELKDGAEGEGLTLWVFPDGNCVVYGGEKADKEACLDFIKEHTDSIDKWYLSDDDGDSMDAYEYCTENGIKVNGLYVVTGIEKIEK